MSYDVVDQAEDASPALPSSRPRPLSMEFDSLTGDVAVVDPSKETSPSVSNLLKSITSASPSYEMVDDDDYEDHLRTPRKEKFPAIHKDEETSEQPPVRTASVSRHLPLNHPTPDLQSLQGAYLKNVERLEESAERLSMTSSHDDEKLERRRSSAASRTSSGRDGLRLRNTSTTSLSNSIIGVNSAARSGGYSPSAFITSPTGSVQSNPHVHRRVSRSSRLGSHFSPELEGRPLDMVLEPSPPTPPRASGDERLDVPADNIPDDEPSSAASDDTFQQANAAFADFDGTHYTTNTEPPQRRQITFQKPYRARDSKMFSEAQPGESMIYYPAPVPVMINLPTKLSKSNHKQQQERRMQALSVGPDEMRKSAIWTGGDEPQVRASVQVPPQLRASAFFDNQPGANTNLQLKNGSAVQTLDSILDAAAHAPVSAFTDHPIVGKLGNEVYGREKKQRKSSQLDVEVKKKRRSSLSNMLKTRKSSSNMEGSRITSRESKVLGADDATGGDELEDAANKSIAPGMDELATPTGEREQDRDDDEGSETSYEEHQQGFSGAPTTLLAELQLRKAQQKQRNRTAADTFPNGMHSTLLEMDAVMQLQQRSRKQKHVTLAWEDHEQADKENFDDEDVPLGVLFPEKDRASHANAHRPIGLLEKREIEDNEPLSHRRARLRGEPVRPPRTITPPRSVHDEETESKLMLDLPGMSGNLEEEEGETLGQRRARMREEKEKVTAGNFASDVASHLGLDAISKEVPPSKTPDAEETLGQRKKRLQAEAAKNGGTRPSMQSRRSMADLLYHNPVGLREVPANVQQFARSSTFGPAQTQNRGSFMPSVPPHMANYYNHSPYMNPAFGMSQPMMYAGGMPQMSNPMAMMMPDPSGPPLNNQQRAVIDRWRQGIA